MYISTSAASVRPGLLASRRVHPRKPNGRLATNVTPAKFDHLLDAGPKTDRPNYAAYEESPINRFLMRIFRQSLKEAVGGEDSKLEGMAGIVELTQRLNDGRLYSSKETRERATQVLRSLFPVWLTEAGSLCISRPFPKFAARLNAWTTSVACTWLMGPMVVNDIELENGQVGRGQGVLVERCRFLEEVSCASICQSSCKLPTQDFFQSAMGIDVTLEPNYEDFSCQFCFGKTPLPDREDPSLQTPCFVQCPTKKRYAPSCASIDPEDRIKNDR